MISIVNLSKSYGEKKVYDAFSLDIEQGKVLCILGESGCGKTTLLNVIAGLTDYSGEVPALRTSYVFSTPRLVPNLTVRGNLALVGADRGEAERLLALVGLEGFGDRHPSQLSDGQAQRVALCRAFLFPSDIMLLDEPFSSLDLKVKLAVMQVFFRLRESRPFTALAVTHDVDEALYLADRIVVLSDGKICGDFKNSPCGTFGADSPLRGQIMSLLLE